MKKKVIRDVEKEYAEFLENQRAAGNKVYNNRMARVYEHYNGGKSENINDEGNVKEKGGVPMDNETSYASSHDSKKQKCKIKEQAAIDMINGLVVKSSGRLSVLKRVPRNTILIRENVITNIISSYDDSFGIRGVVPIFETLYLVNAREINIDLSVADDINDKNGVSLLVDPSMTIKVNGREGAEMLATKKHQNVANEVIDACKQVTRILCSKYTYDELRGKVFDFEGEDLPDEIVAAKKILDDVKKYGIDIVQYRMQSVDLENEKIKSALEDAQRMEMTAQAQYKASTIDLKRAENESKATTMKITAPMAAMLDLLGKSNFTPEQQKEVIISSQLSNSEKAQVLYIVGGQGNNISDAVAAGRGFAIGNNLENQDKGMGK